MRVREPARDARATVHGQMRTGFRLDEMQRTVVEILQARPMPYREQRRPAQLSLEDAYHRFQIVVIERGRRLPALIPTMKKGPASRRKRCINPISAVPGEDGLSTMNKSGARIPCL
jgi:hypothetical protein